MAKILCTYPKTIPESGVGNKYMIKGTQMHQSYSSWAKSFDRLVVRSQLQQFLVNNAFQRQIDNIVIRGMYDDLRVLYNPRTKEKTVSIIEVKTTSRKMWLAEEESAKFQLRLYLWLLEPLLTILGWKLHSRHYVEIYSQKDNHLIKRIMVARVSPEEEIRYIFRSWQGLEKMTVPSQYLCKHCPREIKKKCDWYGYSIIL